MTEETEMNNVITWMEADDLRMELLETVDGKPLEHALCALLAAAGGVLHEYNKDLCPQFWFSIKHLFQGEVK